MSSRPHAALFEATRSALLLPRPTAGRIPAGFDSCKSNLDKSFWILRELGTGLALVDPGVGLPGVSRRPEVPYEGFD
jgi:hypothetical protein